MKKTIVLLLVLSLLVSTGAGCSMGVEGTHNVSLATKPATTKPSDTLPRESEPPMSDSLQTNPTMTAPAVTSPTEPDPSTVPETTPPVLEVKLDQTVVFNEDGIVITATGLKETWSGYVLKVRIENGTDKNIVFSGTDFVVNGIVLTAWAYVDVAAGKKTNEEITFYSDELEAVGITKIATIEGADAHIYDADSYETLYTVPFTLRTSVADSYSQEILEIGELVYDKDGVKVFAQRVKDQFYGHSVRFLVENYSENEFVVTAENVSVNGYTISTWLYDTVYVGTVRYCQMEIGESELEKNEITTLEDISFMLAFYDTNNFKTIDKTDEIVLVVVE